MLQEGLIGLYKAVMSYDIERGSFKSFLSVCASRSMLSALRRMEKEEAVSMETENTPVNNLVDLRQEPEQILFSREEINQLQGRIRQRLSKLELRIFTMYLAGKSYDAIAKEVGKTIKSVDNAIARAKKKVNYMPRELN